MDGKKAVPKTSLARVTKGSLKPNKKRHRLLWRFLFGFVVHRESAASGDVERLCTIITNLVVDNKIANAAGSVIITIV